MENISTDVVIVGAGLCGLSTAYHLRQSGCDEYLIVEREPRVGGLVKTETWDGFSFDHSIHILYTKNPYAESLICNELLADNITRKERRSYCYSHGRYTEYPYQVNNFGLPADVIAENILGLIEAVYATSNQSPKDFEEWIYRTFGAGIAKNFMIPYNRRVWAWDLSEMHFDWIAERVPTPSLNEVIHGALKPPEKKFGPNREYWYPKSGGIESLAKGFEGRIPADRINLGTRVQSIDPCRKTLSLSSGQMVSYQWLVSSLPLPSLIRMLGTAVPQAVHDCAKSLNYNVVHTVNIGLAGEKLGEATDMDWVYYPEEDATVFHRISFPGQFSDWMTPPNCSSIQVEISESKYRAVDRESLVQETLEGLVSTGLLTPEESKPVAQGGRVKLAKVVTLEPAYIIYDHQHRQNINTIREFLDSLQIETRGRFGEWEYFNMDHAIMSGKDAAARITASPIRVNSAA